MTNLVDAVGTPRYAYDAVGYGGCNDAGDDSKKGKQVVMWTSATCLGLRCVPRPLGL